MRLRGNPRQNLPVLDHADARTDDARQKAVVVALAVTQAIPSRVKGQSGHKPDCRLRPKVRRIFGREFGTGFANTVVSAYEISVWTGDRHHTVAILRRIVTRQNDLSSLA